MKIIYTQELKSDLSPTDVIRRILKKRKVSNEKSFLNPPSPVSFTLKDFGFSKKEILQMMEILRMIKERNETVVVYTDYDADGITGGAILWETLYLLGFSVMPYVPHRKAEGYGFSKKGIDTVWKQYHPSLIISCDHGITAKNEVAYAQSLGIGVIITDHHQRQEEKVPDKAQGIFHIPALSGSGTAYMVAKEIATYFKTKNLKKSQKYSEKNQNQVLSHFECDYLLLAAIGTIADLVPLAGASRSIVFHGLPAFSKTKRPGILKLLKEAGVDGKTIRTYEVGFIIAPRINAVGRLTHALDALRLLCTTDPIRAGKLAQKIGSMNVDRQELVNIQVKEAEQKMEKLKSVPKLIILHSSHWHEGVIGLIAGAICTQYYRPTIVMTRCDGIYKASVRSIPGFHVTNFLREIGTLFENFGGHAVAAGFSLKAENLSIFEKEAQEKASQRIDETLLERVIEVDMKIPLSLLSLSLARSLSLLEPYGVGNPKPLFASEVIISRANTVGKNKNHLKIIVENLHQGKKNVEMVAFDMGGKITEIKHNKPATVIYTVDINRWNGSEAVQGVVKHLEL